MPYAIWITGLPGSGKSTIAKALHDKLPDAEYLRLDEIRKRYVKEPKFTDEERELVYTKLVDDGILAISKGKNVIYDATANKLKWRQYARQRIGKFFEVYVKCPVEVCMKRESARGEGLVQADLYKKAIERKATGKNFEGLGKVVGVDAPYEENKNAEMAIDSEQLQPEEAAKKIISGITKKGWS